MEYLNVVIGFISAICAAISIFKQYECKKYYEKCKIIENRLSMISIGDHSISNNSFGNNVHDMILTVK